MNDIFYKRTKIVATVGPAIDSEEMIKALIIAGANVFRLNSSHGTLEEHKNKFEMIKKACSKINAPCAVMVDLQGPKIRVGDLENDLILKEGQVVIFAHLKGDTDKNIIPVDYEKIAQDVKKDEKILLDDGKIQAVIIKIEDNKIYAKIAQGGILKSRKGLNIPAGANSLKSISRRDIDFIKFAIENNIDYIALSFVRNKEDILSAKKYINDLGSDIPIISKLEKPQAIENLESITEVSDGIMIARGDLGIELSPVEVPICQKKIIDECNKQKKPVIVATQMLESMIEGLIPTRAEASDVANAILDGADAVMLSAETSIGKHPIKVVETMAQIANRAENSDFYKFDNDFKMSDEFALERHAIAYGADKMLKYVNAKAILSFSHLGNSTKLISKLKPCAPVILITDNECTQRAMELYWGVYAKVKNWDEVLGDKTLKNIDNFLINEIGLKQGDIVIITGSAPKLITGRTNFIRIHKIS